MAQLATYTAVPFQRTSFEVNVENYDFMETLLAGFRVFDRFSAQTRNTTRPVRRRYSVFRPRRIV